MKDYRIGLLTPISHLPGLDELLNSKGEVFNMEYDTANTIPNTIKACQINTLVCNPNKQAYKLNADILDNTVVSTILTCSTGLSHIDLEYCEANSIEVLSLTTDLDVINQLPSTAELAFILMGNLLRKIPEATDDVEQGSWDYELFIGRQIKGLKIGIVGYGRLGKMMFDYCKAFGANVMAYDPYIAYVNTLSNDRCSSLDYMFEWADVVSLHVHLNDETRNMINMRLLSIPKKPFYLINTSRGGVVNEKAVINALIFGKLTGYATDVLADENGNITDSPILSKINDLNIIVTPHIGGMTWEGQELAYKAAINKL